ncbi:hypothetical protein IV203_011378 [Nitzschia inconspicua]|uniref:Uncharacterized protein n=1 Tax=Nitzschia inconspicua TaxID=303405 RepID=A0A9K3KSL7_9STRA|nr:hypothetical protein IV203_011378 [Nitzschia inconspicua]
MTSEPTITVPNLSDSRLYSDLQNLHHESLNWKCNLFFDDEINEQTGKPTMKHDLCEVLAREWPFYVSCQVPWPFISNAACCGSQDSRHSVWFLPVHSYFIWKSHRWRSASTTENQKYATSSCQPLMRAGAVAQAHERAGAECRKFS